MELMVNIILGQLQHYYQTHRLILIIPPDKSFVNINQGDNADKRKEEDFRLR